MCQIVISVWGRGAVRVNSDVQKQCQIFISFFKSLVLFNEEKNASRLFTIKIYFLKVKTVHVGFLRSY